MQDDRGTARPGRPHRPPPTAPVIGGLVMLLAVLLAIAAASLGLASAQGRAPDGVIMAGVASPHLVFIGIFGAAAVLLAALVLLQQPDGGPNPGGMGPPRGMLFLLPLLLLLGLAGLIAIVSFAPPSGGPAPALGGLLSTPVPRFFATPVGIPTPVTTPGPAPTLHIGAPIWLAPALALALLVLVLACAELMSGRRMPRTLAPTPAPEIPLQEALDEGMEALLHEPDPRRAVIAAYAGMEGALARHGLARRPHEAPFEYLRRVLPAARSKAQALHQLTELYERARFSHHPIAPTMKEAAIEALEMIRADLARAPEEANVG